MTISISRRLHNIFSTIPNEHSELRGTTRNLIRTLAASYEGYFYSYIFGSLNNRISKIPFFYECMGCFMNVSITEFCKIIDKSKTGNNQNVSIDYLFELINKSDFYSSEKKLELEQQINVIKQKSESIKKFRNKMLSHTDYDTVKNFDKATTFLDSIGVGIYSSLEQTIFFFYLMVPAYKNQIGKVFQLLRQDCVNHIQQCINLKTHQSDLCNGELDDAINGLRIALDSVEHNFI